MAEIAFGSGFASIRQFNDTVREVFATSPTGLRRQARERTRARLAGSPCAWPQGRRTRRPEVLLVPRRARGARRRGVGRHAPSPASSTCRTVRPSMHSHRPRRRRTSTARLRLHDLRDLAPAVTSAPRMLDLDADPAAVDDHLELDPALAPLVRQTPGRRVPGAGAGHELAVRAGDRPAGLGGRRPHADRPGGAAGSAPPCRTRSARSPTCSRARGAGRRRPTEVGLTGRRRTVHALAAPWPTGRSPSTRAPTATEAGRQLLAVPGIGPWTAALPRECGRSADPDVLPSRRPRPAPSRSPPSTAPTPTPPPAGRPGGPTPSCTCGHSPCPPLLPARPAPGPPSTPPPPRPALPEERLMTPTPLSPARHPPPRPAPSRSSWNPTATAATS